MEHNFASPQIFEKIQEYLYTSKWGKTINARVQYVPISNEVGTVTLVHLLAENITERVRAEKLQECVYEIARAAMADQSLDQLYAKIHEIFQQFLPTEYFYIARYDRENDLLSFPYFQDAFDSAPSPAKPGRGLTEYVLRTQKPLLATKGILEELIRNGEVELCGPDSVEWLGVPLVAHDQAIGVMVVQSYEESVHFSVQDLEVMTYVSTQIANAIDRKQAQEKLRESEERFRSIYSRVEDVIFETDAKGIILGISPSIEKHCGYLPEELVGRDVRGLYADPDEYNAMKQAMQVDGSVSDFEMQCKKKNGEITVFSVTSHYVYGENGQPVKKEGILRNITERVQAEKAQQKYARQLETINNVTATLSTSLALEDVLKLILEQVQAVISVDSASIFLKAEEGVRIVMDWGVRPSVMGMVFSENELFNEINNRRELLILDEPLADPRFENWGNFEAIRTWIGVPLVVRDMLIGYMTLDSNQPHAFSPDQVSLIKSIAAQSAQALDNARQFGNAQRRLERLASLHDIDQAISSNLDLQGTLNILLGHILQQLQVNAAAVLLYHPELQNLAFAAGQGFRTHALQFTNLRLGEGFAGRVALERDIMQVSDLKQADTGFLRSPEFRTEQFVAYIGVPLVAKGNIIGVLEIYHRQPLKPDPEWMAFLSTLAGQAAIAIDNVNLFSNLQRSNLELVQAYDATIEGWARALELRDMETEGHSRRVVDLTLKLAVKIGISSQELVHMRRGAQLHDIGKMGVPDAILQKRGKLTEKEWEIMRQHPVYAYEMLVSIPYLKLALDIPYCHHEHWDGAGYPRGLKGNQIPLVARIFAVVDVWDALLSDRPYRAAWPREKVLMYIQEQSGKQFDPQVVITFMELLSESKPSTSV